MNDIGIKDQMDYWDNFYSSGFVKQVTYPSQFAAFVAGEMSNMDFVLELGCGSGRDSLFFSALGHKVLGADSSIQAVGHCQSTADKIGVDAKFININVDSADELIKSDIKSRIEESNLSNVLVYTRFFLHAISEEAECNILNFVSSLAKSYSVRFAAEFRTHRDGELPKATSTHYRRFIDPTELISRFSSRDMRVDYFVEGFGYAKYRNDDAHVARFLVSI